MTADVTDPASTQSITFRLRWYCARYTILDHYPINESDQAYAIHQKIDDTLRNCRSAPPRANLGELYPEIFRLTDRSPWLTPALERLDWNLRQDPPGESWAAHLSPLINLILYEVRQGTAAQLYLLCAHAAYLAAHNCHYVAERIATFAWNLHRQAGLSPASNWARRISEPRSGRGSSRSSRASP
jgi:hypothetical protein